MKLSLYDVASIVSDVAGTPHRVSPPNFYTVPQYVFSKKEEGNIAHNFMVAELKPATEDGEVFFNVPTWALTTKCTHRKEERTPAQHLTSIVGLLALMGFETVLPSKYSNVTEEQAAGYAKAAHSDLASASAGLADSPLFSPYAGALRHDQHDRRFCDVVARAVITARFCGRRGIPLGLCSPEEQREALGWMTQFVDMYHDAWGF